MLAVAKAPAALAVLATVSCVAVLAVIEERVAIRLVKDPHTQLLTTIGVATLLGGICTVIWGDEPLFVPPIVGSQAVNILGGNVTPTDIALIVLAIAVTGLVMLLVKRTRAGLAILAIAEDPEAARLVGVNNRVLVLGAFAFSGAIAGLAGLFMAPQTFAVVSSGQTLSIQGFVAAALGGFGSIPGGLIGGFATGIISEIVIRYAGGVYANTVVLALLLTFLLIKPSGLFGRLQERVV
jgi:branched-chain amino acid transport system permease protein